MRLKRVVVLLAALSCHFTAEARFQNLTEQDCEKRVSGAVIERQDRLEVPKWTDDLGLIRADLEEQAWSSVRTYFSKEWDTQVYYTATGAPNRETMEVPLVDPDSKAVVVFFHG